MYVSSKGRDVKGKHKKRKTGADIRR